MKRLIVSLVLIALAISLYGYNKQELKPAPRKKVGTYFTDDERFAIDLSEDDIVIMQNVMKRHTWADQDYNKLINSTFIRRIVGSCGSCKHGSPGDPKCQECTAQTELVRRVLNDFRGRTVQDLFTAIGLRREI